MSVLDLLFPRRCLGCGRFGGYFCTRCRRSLVVIGANETVCPICEKPAIDGASHPKCLTRYGLDGLISFFRYKGAMRLAIKTLKYRFVFDLVPELISLIPEAAYIFLRRLPPMVIVPIPLHVSRQRSRGFNQAELLGTELAARLHMPIRTDMLQRIKPTIPQAGIAKRQERLANMKDVFAVSAPITGASCVFLVDDVFTTGATLRAAASTLKRAGVRSVWGLVIAR